MKLKFRTGYEDDYDSLMYSTHNNEPSMTHQEFQDESDINYIVDSMARVGLLDQFQNQLPALNYADVSNVSDYQQALQIVMDADEMFSSLDAKIRRRFDNDPAELLHFLNNPDNKDEAEKLGLITSPVKAESIDSGRAHPPLDVMGTTDTVSHKEGEK